MKASRELEESFVAFLNNDIVVEDEFVERCLARFEDGDDVFAVCPRILEMSGGEQGSRTSGYWHRGLIFYRPLPHSPAPTDCFFAVGGQSFFRHEMLKEIGSIDPLFWPMYHEDIELSYRAWKRGWRVRYAPDAVAHHVGGHSSRRVFSPSQLRVVRAAERVPHDLERCHRPAVAGRASPFHSSSPCGRALKRDWPTLVGFSRAVGRLPAGRCVAARRREHICGLPTARFYGASRRSVSAPTVAPSPSLNDRPRECVLVACRPATASTTSDITA